MGMTLFLISVALVIFTLSRGLIIPFLSASALSGASWGLAYTGSLQSMVIRTGAESRAGVLSAACMISYGGAAVPSLLVGKLAGSATLFEIAMMYGMLVLFTWVFVCVRTAKSNAETSMNISGELSK